MNISQAAAASGLSAKQIRDYEKYGLLHSSRNPSGYRQYSSADIKRLQFIRQARAVGFSLAQISRLLHLQENPHRHSSEVKSLTAAHIAEIKTQIADLQHMLALLQDWHDACQGNDCPDCAILDSLQQTAKSSRQD